MRLLLQLEGHAIDTARDGVRTIERAAAFRPHLVLVDIALPDIDGHEVARRIRSLALPTPPYLAAMTGYGDHNHKHRSAEAGFDLHLTKPVDVEVFAGPTVRQDARSGTVIASCRRSTERPLGVTNLSM